jgi:hypothetical protein
MQFGTLGSKSERGLRGPLIAVDLDGTLDSSSMLLRVMRCLKSDGDMEVIVLTCCQGGKPTFGDKIRKLKDLLFFGLYFPEEGHAFGDNWPEVLPSEPVFVLEGKDQEERANLKAKFCAKYGVKLLIDDDPVYCQRVRELSPGTTVLQFLAPLDPSAKPSYRADD